MTFDLIGSFKDLKRLEEILSVFLDEGFGFVIDEIKLGKYLPFLSRLRSKVYVKTDSPQVRLRRSFERLGPAFIKLGQILSLRPDLVPYDYALEFEKTQERVKPFSYEVAKYIVESELGKPLSSLFKSFDKKPIASASISQVHRAVLKNGKVVAVKIKRPDADKIFKNDIHLIKSIAKLIDRYSSELRKFRFEKISSEFESWTLRELDFKIEALNLKRFIHNFKNDKHIVFPKVYDDYTTRNVLVTEFIDGISLHDFENVKKKHKDVELIINRGYSAILTQVFEHGFFHADPHPGNMLVLKNGDLAFLDFGIVGRFSQELKDRTISIVYGVLNSDVDLVMREFLKFGTSSKINVYDFKRELSELFDPLILVSDLKDVELGQIISKSIDLARKYDITIPVDYILFGKTLMTIEGVGLRYDPNFNVIAITKPKLEKIFKSRYSLLSIKKNVAHDMELYGDLAKTLPEKASKILDLFGRGKIDIDIEDRDIVNLTDEMERSAGNIALGFIVAALIVGSALIMQIETQKMFYNFPLIPMIGFIFAGLLGIWIVKRTIFISVRRM